MELPPELYYMSSFSGGKMLEMPDLEVEKSDSLEKMFPSVYIYH